MTSETMPIYYHPGSILDVELEPQATTRQFVVVRALTPFTVAQILMVRESTGNHYGGEEIELLSGSFWAVLTIHMRDNQIVDRLTDLLELETFHRIVRTVPLHQLCFPLVAMFKDADRHTELRRPRPELCRWVLNVLSHSDPRELEIIPWHVMRYGA